MYYSYHVEFKIFKIHLGGRGLVKNNGDPRCLAFSVEKEAFIAIPFTFRNRNRPLRWARRTSNETEQKGESAPKPCVFLPYEHIRQNRYDLVGLEISRVSETFTHFRIIFLCSERHLDPLSCASLAPTCNRKHSYLLCASRPVRLF